VLLLLAAILSATITLGHADAPPPLVDPPRDASQLNDAVTKLVRRLDAGKRGWRSIRSVDFCPFAPRG
jgi:hypothetical protein